MKTFVVILLALCLCLFVRGQPGISEMQQVRSDIRNSFFSAWDASLVLAAIFGITGALRIYHNLQMGRERLTPDVTAWFLAAIFMVLAGAFLKALLGL